MSKSLTEAARAVLEQSLNEGATLPTVGSLSGGVSNPNPVSPATLGTQNARSLRPGGGLATGAEGDPKHNEAEDLGGATPTSPYADNLGSRASSKNKKDTSKASRASVAPQPSQKLSEDEDVDGEVMEEDIEISEELAAFIEDAIDEGFSEEEIMEAIDENFEFVSEEDDQLDEDEELEDYTIDMSEHVNALLEGENLSEEFHAKATTIFEAAVKSKLEEEVALLEEAYAETLEERVADIVEQLTSDVDDYLSYVVEQWMGENEIAIESSLRSELTEDFISGLRALFAEHYIDIPEESVDVVEELSQTVEDLENALNEEIERNVQLTSALNESHKIELVSQVCEGLTTNQAEKLKALAENVAYTSPEEFIEKIETLRENYFPTSIKTDEVLDRVDASNDPQSLTESTLEGPMARYVQAIGKNLPR